MRTRLALAAAVLLSLCTRSLFAAEPKDTPRRPGVDTRWFRDAKFGMFIHWGLYAQAGGVWKDQKYFGIGEWLMYRARIPTKQYEILATQFNPVKFDAKQWVGLAKAAGMKYIVITSKHHDGFAMFKSQASKFNIVDATPFRRDPLRELADACQEAGIKLCFYHSQYQDWHEPGGGGNSWEFPNNAKRFDEYFRTKCVPQVKELLSNYGPLGLIWFDTPGSMTREQSLELVDLVHRLQPNCLVSSRVGNDLGDFTDLGDHELPATVMDGPWESLFTHNDSWGYVWYDKNWRSTRELVHMLLKTNGKGGNFLLNVGPQADGAIPDPSVQVLRRVGEWVQKNAESLYGSTHSPFPELTWGECTAKPGALYCHVLNWPADGLLRIPGLANEVRGVSLLASGSELPYRRAGSDVLVELPGRMPDPVATTVKLRYEGQLKVDPLRTLMPGLANTFTAVETKVGGKVKAHKYSWMEEFGDWKHAHVVEGWSAPADAGQWSFRVVRPGQYRVLLTYSRSGPGGRHGQVEAAGQTLWFEVQNTGREPRHFFTHTLGVLTFDKPGPATLRIAPSESGDELFKLNQVVLEPFE